MEPAGRWASASVDDVRSSHPPRPLHHLPPSSRVFVENIPVSGKWLSAPGFDEGETLQGNCPTKFATGIRDAGPCLVCHCPEGSFRPH